jgi:pilus assembly protein CpaC
VAQLLDGYTGLRVRRVGARFFIEGGVATEAEQKRFEQIAKLYPGQVESLVAVGPGGTDRLTNIRLDFFFVQYQKTSTYQFGISWPTTIGAAAIQSNLGYDFVAQVVTANFTVVNQPLPGLDIAATHGWAKVLKQATVITTNGVQAKFGNGGEQNFPISAGLTGSIQKIKFGTELTVLPRFDPRTNDLEVQVDADVSDLTAAGNGTTLPGRQTASLTTLVHMRLGQSIVLSGIDTKSQNHQVAGIPLLSQIPILGVFFGSHNDSETDVEGAVFIVPSIVDSNEKSARAMIEEAMKQYERFSGNLRKVNSFDKMPVTEGGRR